MGNKGVFVKGDSRAGRPRGTPNRVTADLRHMVLEALDEAGGTSYLVRQAQENPQAFLALLAKCLPKDIRLGMLDYLELNFISVNRGTG